MAPSYSATPSIQRAATLAPAVLCGGKRSAWSCPGRGAWANSMAALQTMASEMMVPKTIVDTKRLD